MIIGIYKITSPLGKIYIGQSIDIEKRWKRYIGVYCKTQIKLYNSLKEYGWESHQKEIIEECPESYLNELEIWWKMFYGVQCVENGLCCSYWDKSPMRGRKQTLETINKISISNKGKAKNHGEKISRTTKGKPKPEGFNKNLEVEILQYSKSGIFIKEWFSLMEVSKTLNISQSNISQGLLSVTKSAGGFQWRYKTDNYPLKIEPVSKNGNKGKSKPKGFGDKLSRDRKGKVRSQETINKIKVNNKGKNNKSILQYDKDNKFIKVWDSINNAGNVLNINKVSIVNNASGRSKSAGGFKWRYKI